MSHDDSKAEAVTESSLADASVADSSEYSTSNDSVTEQPEAVEAAHPVAAPQQLAEWYYLRQQEAARVADLTGQVAAKQAELIAEEKQTPYYIIAVVISGMLATLSGFYHWATWASILLTTLVVLFLASLGGHVSGVGKRRGELEKAKAELEITRELPAQLEGDSSSSYFQNLVTINVTNLREYYFLVKTHTNSSFKTALGVGVAGFALVCVGLIGTYFGAKSMTFQYVAVAAGTITEFIAGVFFYLYNKTVRQLKDYHDSLLDVQNVLLSLKLVESVEDAQLRAPMITQMLSFLMRMERHRTFPDLAEVPLASRTKTTSDTGAS